jgi:hypothetical protein
MTHTDLEVLPLVDAAWAPPVATRRRWVPMAATVVAVAALVAVAVREVPRAPSPAVARPTGGVVVRGPNGLFSIDVDDGHAVRIEPPSRATDVLAVGSSVVYLRDGMARVIGGRADLGAADAVVPAAVDDKVWLVGDGLAREVDVATGVTQQALRIPDGRLVMADMGTALLLDHNTMWDTATGATSTIFGGESILAARGRTVVRVDTNGLSVRSRQIAFPFRVARATPAAQSADGRWLAVVALGEDERVRLIAVDLETLRWRQVANLGSYETLPFGPMAWSSDGWLYVATGARQLSAWRPWSPHGLVQLHVKVPPITQLAAS